MSAEPSGPPEQVTLGDVTSTSIKVTWSPVKVEDRNGIIKGYKVIYRALPNGDNDTEVVNITIESQDTGKTLSLERLNEFTNYSIRVLAFTAIGDGPLSVAEVKQTLEDGKFLFGIYASDVTLKYTAAACIHIILTAFFILFKNFDLYVRQFAFITLFHRQTFLCGKIFSSLIFCHVLFIFFNFMKGKIVS